MIEIEGEYTTAKVMGITEEQLEDSAREQIEEMVNHPAFTKPVRVMPDCHYGAGAVIGFTMPLADRVVPNVVGLDIGCGMEAQCIGDELPISGENLDEKVRNKVPMGWGKGGLSSPDRDYYHIKNDFPWDTVNERLETFIESTNGDWVDELEEFADNGGYDIDYFKKLVRERAGTMGRFDINSAINSVGTLGSGNHFIEIGESQETGEYWVTIHSGSRGLGGNTAEYWQEKATEYMDEKHNRDDRVERIRSLLSEYPTEFIKFDESDISDRDVLDWVQGGMGEDFINYDAIPKPERESVREDLKEATQIANEGGDTSEPLDYLEGKEAAGYLRDMIFCQQYAVENRRMMARAVAEALGVEPTDTITATHNFIDFRDGVIRKGATRSHEGERAVVPFNMADGILLTKGKSNNEWNYSVAHGAGRQMSRRAADDMFDEEEVRAEMEENGVFATAFPTDEAPGAYKPAELIQEAIKPTAEIIDKLDVVHNWKADD